MRTPKRPGRRAVLRALGELHHVGHEHRCREHCRALAAVGDESHARLVQTRSLYGEPRLQSRVRRRENHLRPRMDHAWNAHERRLPSPVQCRRPVAAGGVQRAELSQDDGSQHGARTSRTVGYRPQAFAESRIPGGARRRVYSGAVPGRRARSKTPAVSRFILRSAIRKSSRRRSGRSRLASISRGTSRVTAGPQ